MRSGFNRAETGARSQLPSEASEEPRRAVATLAVDVTQTGSFYRGDVCNIHEQRSTYCVKEDDECERERRRSGLVVTMLWCDVSGARMRRGFFAVVRSASFLPAALRQPGGGSLFESRGGAPPRRRGRATLMFTHNQQIQLMFTGLGCGVGEQCILGDAQHIGDIGQDIKLWSQDYGMEKTCTTKENEVNQIITMKDDALRVTSLGFLDSWADAGFAGLPLLAVHLAFGLEAEPGGLEAEPGDPSGEASVAG
ncbi:hypothetical protein EYF80_054629 [Liparis tanakae]|uniref:Uncharacterized protein n=1 Tax=Liparis tanakae TaxID=230148 RepID=A0A4Z2F1W7_9TELE|nr:hypothetical protein EYF80_054629 [Liparis tanakae]